jgi:hypothetical protein
VKKDIGLADGRLIAARQRFERSFVGEVVISAGLTILLLIGVAWNLPDSNMKSSIMPVLRPVAAAAGMQSTWQMYAPDPISAVESVQVHVQMSDGSARTWEWRPGDKVIGPFTWYRWQKLREQVIRQPDSRPGLAHWVVRQLTAPGERAVHVDMLFRNELLPAPGSDRPNGTNITNLYSEDLNGGR